MRNKELQEMYFICNKSICQNRFSFYKITFEMIEKTSNFLNYNKHVKRMKNTSGTRNKKKLGDNLGC